MAHTHDVYDMESHFEINGSSRFIKETSETKLVVVQGDHNSEIVSFKMPRYIDGHDMLLCNKVRVHYINIETGTNNKSADIYEVTDLTLCEECEDVLTFTWKVEAPATKYYGPLSFLVKFECTEGSNVLYQWNTAKYVGVNVLAGIDNSEEFVEKYSSVLEEWYSEITGGADTIGEMTERAMAEIEFAKENAKQDIENKAQETLNVIRTVDIEPNNGITGSPACQSVTIKTTFDCATIHIVGLRGNYYNFALFTIPDELLPSKPLSYKPEGLTFEIFSRENFVYVTGDFTSGEEIVIDYTLKTSCIPEIVDMRTGYDGKVYASAGEAVREQIKKAMQTGGGAVTDEQIAIAVKAYLEENPVQSGATEEQAQQIEFNTNGLKNLQEVVAQMKNSLTDTITGKEYKLKVVNGNLVMEEVIS